jgi:hypothetical protein
LIEKTFLDKSGAFMNIRTVLCGLMISFCSQAAAMDQEQVMTLIQQGSPSDIREFVQAQCPADSSFLMNTLRNVTFEAVAALLIQDKFGTTSGKVVAGALGLLVAAEGASFVGGAVQFVTQKAQQEKLFRYFMNIRKGMEMRKNALESDDSESTNSETEK